MSRPSPEAKAKARRKKEVADDVSKIALGASPFVLPLHVVAIGTAAVGALSGILANRLQRFADDPPRDDYFDETKVEASTLNTSRPGDSPVAVATSGLLVATDRTVRDFDALILALERASGAEENGSIAMEQARVAEVLEFATDAGQSLVESGTLTARYRDALGEYRGRSYEVEPVDDLPTVIDAVRTMGIPLEPGDLAAVGAAATDDPLGPLIDVLAEAAESDYEFGSYLTTAASNGTLIEQHFEPEASTQTSPV